MLGHLRNVTSQTNRSDEIKRRRRRRLITAGDHLRERSQFLLRDHTFNCGDMMMITNQTAVALFEANANSNDRSIE